jgi:signal transduction histidine kinase
VRGPIDASAFAAINDVVMAINAEVSLERVLERLVHAARDLVGAEYAAIGVPDETGRGFATFLTSGMSDEQIEAIGWLPRTHGMLGVMLADPTPYRTKDIQADPRFEGWPAAHPDMHAFLGVPIVARGDVVGSFYLTDKPGGFGADDQLLIELLAAHAAIAMESARLHDDSRRLAVLQERNRLARELHDALSQQLFSAALTVDAARALIATAPDRAGDELVRAKQLVRDAQAELRTLVFELRPPDLAEEGLAASLRKQLALTERVSGVPIELHVEGRQPTDPGIGAELSRIVVEAVANAVRHGRPDRVQVHLVGDADGVVATVLDDGIGFDPQHRRVGTRTLGLTSMRERAEALGGRLRVQSAPGRGTTVRVEVPGA